MYLKPSILKPHDLYTNIELYSVYEYMFYLGWLSGKVNEDKKSKALCLIVLLSRKYKNKSVGVRKVVTHLEKKIKMIIII